jgi:hypothetical protein
MWPWNGWTPSRESRDRSGHGTDAARLPDRHTLYRPYRGHVILAGPQGARITFSLSDRGRVVAEVPPGTYRMTAPSSRLLPGLSTVTLDGRAIPRVHDASYSIIVRTGALEHLRLWLDAGIR